ncbi:DUF447 domain-containing protein [Sulfolobus acidocaldarius]|uniref:Conserved protein n=4 Tax=Sulfolobus acidocaldarius TaxID=2285 RepID=Q4JB36_SULAC|nr:DUF447 domain-containing protein [Sulfolobus acidocaldarius]AAY79993.1 conserved protein [Sulfolobus acidocaldarius DSM 639]AGE70562.1 hypothetical protein SacN8_02920 [Sulfolobus acidocaldarius N8]AGE72835.1 hypothetical protein SacRon12I_02910 [Sulfolobus acidocaldarius Ron12/I]ALU29079.1 hypothetical protein ATY89_03390 [Sulfolobus acidocaldarius]ALU31805.1 hypothetical protein ATZ20_06415 [Sulfolobus acidocaldarius]
MADDNLLDFIFPHDGYYEVILGTNGVRLNLSPIGIIREGQELKSRIYEDTLTFQNVMKNNKCSINITLDPFQFYYGFTNNIDKLRFRLMEEVPVLENSLVILSELTPISRDQNPIIFKYNRLHVVSNAPVHQALSRGDFLLVDLLVHMSRLHIYSQDQIKQYLPVIEYEIKTIKRLSPNLSGIIQELIGILEDKGYKISL